jgi:photosystem II stability/assembly factor-like uncharacterized protein
MATEDDELERRLRDVLRSGGLGMPVPPDAIDRIHAGARRRQQRRSAGAALGAVVVIGVVAGAIGLNVGGGHGSSVAAKVSISSASVVVSSSPSGVASSTVPVSSPASPSASGVIVVPTAAPAVSTPPTQVFNPVSVSAVGVNDWWVLGYITADSGSNGITVMKTTDAGQHFTKVGAPSAFVTQMVASVPPDTPMVSGIRFGDLNNGWAYGSSLFETSDGGTSWSAVTGVPGDVVDLAAASGNVWAVSNPTNTTTFALYHATYGVSGTGTWTKVPLGTSIAQFPGLAVVKQTAFLLAELPTGRAAMFAIAGDGKSLVSRAAPCASTGNTVSVAGDGALWIRCDGNPDSLIFVSSDEGVHWQQANAATGAATVGGVDGTHAITEDADGLRLISTAGDSTPVPYAAGANVTLPGFIGFTTTTIGFIVTDGNGSQLWRTTDGGQTWTVVTF